jgi:glutathione synthase/RimK-type ligase-like ATP-grasp enzyme
MRPRVALATYDRAPQLAPDDRLILPALTACAVTAEAVVWTDASVQWAAFDAVIIRSCWDYHLQLDAFVAWLGSLAGLGVRVFNTPPLVRWNANKRYLLDLAQRGVATIPTVIVPRGRTGDVEAIVTAEGWPHFVIKPAVSASGYDTYAMRVPLDPASRALVERVTATGDTLLQPFAEEVRSTGEFSLMFIDGAFSHAALKRAAGGEFRVQTEHGGTVDPIAVEPTLIDQAARVLSALPETPLYARVDGIVRDDAFLLMELELIEPNLFFDTHVGAVEEFAKAVVRRL